MSAKKPSRRDIAYAKIRAKYPTYPAMRAKGMTQRRIAEDLGVCHKMMSKIQDAFGLGKRLRCDVTVTLEEWSTVTPKPAPSARESRHAPQPEAADPAAPYPKHVTHAQLRDLYPTYPDLCANGLDRHEIAAELGIPTRLCWRLHDAFESRSVKPPKTIKARTPREKPEIRRLKYPTFPALVAQGMTRKEIAAALHVGEDVIFKLRSAFAIKGHCAAFPRQGRVRRPITEVHPGIDDALRRGGSYRAIGAEFGLCRERVRQIAKSLGIEKVGANPGQRKRTASGLTLYQQRLTVKYPDLLNPLVVPREVTGVCEDTVYKIRKILGISFIASRSPLTERLVSVIDGPITILEISSSIGSVRVETLHIYLSMLARRGHLKRLARGIYAPANWPEEGSP